MQEGVAVFHLQNLPYANTYNAGIENAAFLVDSNRLSGDRSLRNVSLQSHKNVREAAVDGCDNILLQNALARTRLGAHRIHSHPDDGIPGQLAAEVNTAFDGASIPLGGSFTGQNQQEKYR